MIHPPFAREASATWARRPSAGAFSCRNIESIGKLTDQPVRSSPFTIEIAAYCESDVINTYRVWVRAQRGRGAVDQTKWRGARAFVRQWVQDARPAKGPPTLLRELLCNHSSDRCD